MPAQYYVIIKKVGDIAIFDDDWCNATKNWHSKSGIKIRKNKEDIFFRKYDRKLQ